MEQLAKQTNVPADKVVALMKLAEAAHHHPFLMRIAVAELKQPDQDWDTMLARVQKLAGRAWQEMIDDWIGKMCAALARACAPALTLIQALTVFGGGASKESLQRVWSSRATGSGNPDAEEFSQALIAAQDASLLDFDRTSRRYDLHPFVRKYLDRQLAS